MHHLIECVYACVCICVCVYVCVCIYMRKITLLIAYVCVVVCICIYVYAQHCASWADQLLSGIGTPLPRVDMCVCVCVLMGTHKWECTYAHERKQVSV